MARRGKDRKTPLSSQDLPQSQLRCLREALAALIDAVRDLLEAPAGTDNPNQVEEIRDRYLILCELAAELGLPRPPGSGSGDWPDWLYQVRLWHAEATGQLEHDLKKQLEPLESGQTNAATTQRLLGYGEGQPTGARPKGKKKTRGRPRQSDPESDRKVYENWKASRLTVKEFARANSQSSAEIEAACKRHRTRASRL
jgi:hypothetical protein